MKLRVVVILALVAALVGACGSPDGADQTTTPDAESTTSVDPASDTTLADQPTTTATVVPLEGSLVVWDWQSGNLAPGTQGSVWQQLDEAFMEQHPGVQIERVGQPFANYFDAVRAAFTAGTGPDVATFFGGPNVLSFSDALIPLDDMVTEEMLTERVGWDDAQGPDGTTWLVPQGLNGIVWYFNKQLFTDAGLDPDDPPTTFAELVAAAEALDDSGVIPIAGGNAEGGFAASYVWSLLWPGNGTNDQAIELGNGGIDWDHPVVVQTTEQMVELFQNYWDPDYASSPFFQGPSLEKFKLGEAAIHPGPISGRNASYVDLGEAIGQDNLGVFFTTGENEPNYLPGGIGVGWGISSQAENPELAFEFLKYITGPDGAALMLEEAAYFPQHLAVEFGADAAPQVQDIRDGFDQWGIAYYPHGQFYGPEAAEWTAQVQSLLAGDCEIAECYQSVQQVRDDHLESQD